MFLFDLYRRLLMLICLVYGVVRLGQAAGRWAGNLAGPQAHKRLMRGYVGVMLASVRLRRFWVDLLQIAALVAALGGVLYAHRFVM